MEAPLVSVVVVIPPLSLVQHVYLVSLFMSLCTLRWHIDANQYKSI